MGGRSGAKKAKRQPYKLNYNLVPNPEYTHVFWDLPKELETPMQKLPQTRKRINAALLSSAQIDATKPEEPNAQLKAESSFRSALYEYAAIEDILNRELHGGKREFWLANTENPLPHILKQLRNLQVHLIANEMSDFAMSLWLKLVPGAEPVTVTRWIISDLDDTQLLELDAFKKGYYTEAQATEMVNWIKNRQTLFGIGDIIHRGVLETAERIVTTYLT